MTTSAAFPGLAAPPAWMCYANLVGGLSPAGGEEEYAELLLRRTAGVSRPVRPSLLRVCSELAAKIAVYAVEVHAIRDEAGRFYQKYGFEPLAGDRLHLYLTMKAIRKLKLGG